MLLTMPLGERSAYVGSAPDWRPGFGCAEWLLCSDGVFPRCGPVVTRPQLVAKGNARARVVEALLGDLHRVVSGVQLGITLNQFGDCALGEATFAKMIQAIWPRGLGAHTALFAHAIALACAFAMLSALHVVIGELVPKTLSLARAERVALLVALPFRWFLNTFHLAIHLLDGISGAIVKALGVTSAQVHGVAHSTEELQSKFSRPVNAGLIAPGEEKFILSAMETRADPSAGDYGAAAGHTHASRGIQFGRSDASFRNNAAFADPCLPRHGRPHPRLRAYKGP